MWKLITYLVLFKLYYLEYIPQILILGPILFNILLNNLLTVLKKSQLYNFADDNNIFVVSKALMTL